MSYNNNFSGGNSWGQGGGGFDRPPRQMHPVNPPVQCAHVDEAGNQCPEMITELPFDLQRDESGNPLKPVYYRNHIPARQDAGARGGAAGGFSRPERQMFPVDPPVQCAHVDEAGNPCPEMITELPFELQRDSEGNPLKPVYCRNHLPARPPRRDNFFGGGGGRY